MFHPAGGLVLVTTEEETEGARERITVAAEKGCMLEMKLRVG